MTYSAAKRAKKEELDSMKYDLTMRLGVDFF